MWKVTVKGLLAHKIRFVMTGVAVIIGVAFMAGSLILTDTISRTFDNLFASVYAHTDAVVREKAVLRGEFDRGRPRLDASVLSTVRSVSGVKVAYGSVQGFARIDDPRHATSTGRGRGGGPRGGGFAWIPDPNLSDFHVVSGRAPRAPREIVVDKHTAGQAGYRPGSRIKVVTTTGVAEYTITGIIRFGTQDSLLNATVVGFTPETAGRVLGAPGKLDQIVVRSDAGVSQTQVARRIRAAVSDRNGNPEVLTGRQAVQETQNNLKNRLSYLPTFLLVFAGIALLVGAFVIFNTFSILVSQRTREMALLRAVGAARRQVLGAVMVEAVLVGLFASAIGIVAGVGLSEVLKALLGGFGFRIPAGGTVFETRTAVESMIVGTSVTVVAAALPAVKASRVAPIAALRDVAVDRSATSARRLVAGVVVTGLGAVVVTLGVAAGSLPETAIGGFIVFLGVVILGPVIARPVAGMLGVPLRRFRGMTGTLATENAMRNPRRTAATAAALMIGVGIVGLIMVLAASTKASFSALLGRVVKADLVVESGSFRRGGMLPSVEDQLRAIPGVRAITAAKQGAMEVAGSVSHVTAYDPKTLTRLLDPGVVRGDIARLGADGLAVQQDTAKSHHWTVGSRVPVRFVSTGRHTFTVEAIYKEDTPFGSYVLGTDAYVQNFTEVFDREIYLSVDGAVSPATTAAIKGALADTPGATVRTRSAYISSETSRLDPILALVYVLLALSIVIALFGIYNTLGLSVYERTRELGLLRAVGMTRAQMRASVRWESVIVALLGTLLGLVIGLAFAWIMITALATEGLDRLTFPIGQLAAVVVIAAICGLVAAVLPARRAGRLDVLTAIATE